MRHRFGFALALLFCFVARAGAIPQTFSFDANSLQPPPNSIHLAGDFNGWSKDHDELTDDDRDGVWTITIDLDEGRYFYKFVVNAGGPGERWLNDPNADKSLDAPDGHGGVNSSLIVGPVTAKFDPPTANHINMAGLVFDVSRVEDFNVVDTQAGTVRFRLRTQAGDVERVLIRAFSEGWHSFELHRLCTEAGFDVFGGVFEEFPLTGDYDGRQFLLPTAAFYFEIIDGTARAFVGADGVSGSETAARENAFTPGFVTNFKTPDWARDVVWYQIFPERFRNGDPSNDPGDFPYETKVPWTAAWYSTMPGEVAGAENFYFGAGNVWRRRFGGDLAGIREKLPYLKSLGVTAIYLNPIFEAESMHKYDTADFRHIDDNFGVRDTPHDQRLGNRQLFELDGTPMPAGYVETDDPRTWRWTKSDLYFLDFLKAARANGMRVIIDGVFNHVGRAHPYFQDVMQKGQASRFADWFDIEQFADTHPTGIDQLNQPGGMRYRAWDGPSGHLPNFRKNEYTGLAPGPYRHIMNITRRWMDPNGDGNPEDGVDGWRLDVAPDVPMPFWRDWRILVKSINPDAYISGEIWPWAMRWINAGDQFDAVMNYQFAIACQDFFADKNDQLSPSEFATRLTRLIYNYPLQSALVMQNLLDSHDTDRAVMWFINPDRQYDGSNRMQDNAAGTGYVEREPTETEWKRFKQMVAFQMSFVGAPMIYYGDEAGMFSSDDPNNRMPLPWPDLGENADPAMRFRADVFDYYQRFAAIRHALPQLRRGDFVPILVDDSRGIFAFERRIRAGQGKPVYVVLNRSENAVAIELPVDADSYVDFANDANVSVIDAGNTISMNVTPNATKLDGTSGTVGVNLAGFGVAILVGAN